MHHYESLQRLVGNEPGPSFWVDMDALDRNLDRVVNAARSANKTVRIATKSIRVPFLIRYLREHGQGVLRGLMCYTAAEARALAALGEDDLLVAYPCVDADELRALAKLHGEGLKVSLVVDEKAHLDAIEAALPADAKLPVCIDVDVSYRVAGRHLGVRRSPITDLEKYQAFVRQVQACSKARLVGVMAYEAQIAGLTDSSPYRRLMNYVAWWLKQLSRTDVERRRREISEWTKEQGITLEFFNGGGSGSLSESAYDSALTEVAVGSGFLQSHLFDYYRVNRNEPASFFMLRVTRIPAVGFVTCHGGGFVASGAPGWEKCPRVYQPKGLTPLPDEGFGEVQSPFAIDEGAPQPKVGDPVFLRSAKAGEIAEYFSHYNLYRGENLWQKVPTYRGAGIKA